MQALAARQRMPSFLLKSAGQPQTETDWRPACDAERVQGVTEHSREHRGLYGGHQPWALGHCAAASGKPQAASQQAGGALRAGAQALGAAFLQLCGAAAGDLITPQPWD